MAEGLLSDSPPSAYLPFYMPRAASFWQKLELFVGVSRVMEGALQEINFVAATFSQADCFQQCKCSV